MLILLYSYFVKSHHVITELQKCRENLYQILDQESYVNINCIKAKKNVAFTHFFLKDLTSFLSVSASVEQMHHLV